MASAWAALRARQSWRLVRQWPLYGRSFATVVTWGDGSAGALGPRPAGPLGDAWAPLEVAGLPADVASVHCGHYHTLALTRHGQLWSWGRGTDLQLGRPLLPASATAATAGPLGHPPGPVEGFGGRRIVAAAASGVASFAVDEAGDLWSFGRSAHGQLGHALGPSACAAPTRVEALRGRRVVAVSAGWGHAAALTDEGELWAWGYAAGGRLGCLPAGAISGGPGTHSAATAAPPRDAGRSGTDDTATLRQAMRTAAAEVDAGVAAERAGGLPITWAPVRVDAARTWGGGALAAVACGLDHTLVVRATDGAAFAFGDDDHGQCGGSRPLGSGGPAAAAVGDAGPTPVGACTDSAPGHRLALIAAGLGHNLATCVAHGPSEVLTWGWNGGLQLGRPLASNISRDFDPVPRLADPLDRDDADDAAGHGAGGTDPERHWHVTRLSAGRVHSLAVGAGGQLWAWGSNRNGRLGLGLGVRGAASPTLVAMHMGVGSDRERVRDAAAGLDHTVALLE